MPRHMGVGGNKRLDETAKKVAEKKEIRWYPEQFSSLAYMGRTLSERK